METNEQLVARYQIVKRRLELAQRSRDRCKPGSNRDNKSRWCGCILFNLESIRAEMRQRGLPG